MGEKADLKKYKILSTLSKLHVGNSISIILLKQFLASEKIKKLAKDDNVSFRNYLSFIQTVHPKINIANIFTEPALTTGGKDEKFLHVFMQEEQINHLIERPIISNKTLGYKFETVISKAEPASALASLSDRNILSSTCYVVGSPGYDQCYGIIVLRNPTGDYIRTLVNEPASTLAVMPDGNFLTGTCYVQGHDRNRCYGEIVLRDHTGKRIKTLACEPASALVVLPDRNILSGTCYVLGSPGYDNCYGEIVLRDPTGNRIRTLVNEPASTLTVMPDKNIISGTCYVLGSPGYDNCYGEIVLRDPTGNRIRTLVNEPASTFTVMPDTTISIGTCYVQGAYRVNVYGKITIGKFKLVERKAGLPFSLQEKVNALLVDMTALSCIQFNYGRKDPTSTLSRLSYDVSSIIYAYAFPFPAERSSKIINHYSFPYIQAIDVAESPLDEVFGRKVASISFFKKPMNADLSKNDQTLARISQNRKY